MSKIPFTAEQFLQVFEKYDRAIYPFQFALILVAIIVPIAIFIILNVLHIYRSTRTRSRWRKPAVGTASCREARHQGGRASLTGGASHF